MEEEEILEGNTKLEDHKIALVSRLDLLPLAASFIRPLSGVCWDRSRYVGGQKRKVWYHRRGELWSRWLDTERGTVRHVDIGADRVDCWDPILELGLRDTHNVRDGGTRVIGSDTDGLACVSDEEGTGRREVGKILTQGIIQVLPIL